MSSNPQVLLAGGGVMAATIALGLTQTQVAQATVVEDRIQGVVQYVDGLYDSNKWKEALTYLEQHKDTNNHELLWRLARLCYKVGTVLRGKLKVGNIDIAFQFVFLLFGTLLRR